MKKCFFIFLTIFLLSCTNRDSNNAQNESIVAELFEIENIDTIDIITEIERIDDVNLTTIFYRNVMTHYARNNIYLRYSDNFESTIITTLPQYHAVRIIETGRIETIEEIPVTWLKIISQTGFVGWCISADIGLIEGNIAEEIASLFSERMPGFGFFPSLRGLTDRSPRRGVTSIDEIIQMSGFYIQQKRDWHNFGRIPSILKLSVDDGIVYIREIDIVDNEKVIRNEITLQFDGVTYRHYHITLEEQNGKIQIMNREHITGRRLPPGVRQWDFNAPFEFAGDLYSPIPYIVHRLTTDYLKTFQGIYVVDTYKIIYSSKGLGLGANRIRDMRIYVEYDQENKWLSIPNFKRITCPISPDMVPIRDGLASIETTVEFPFYWNFGEGAGFFEEMVFFYKGGIVLYFNSVNSPPDEETIDLFDNTIKSSSFQN